MDEPAFIGCAVCNRVLHPEDGPVCVDCRETATKDLREDITEAIAPVKNAEAAEK